MKKLIVLILSALLIMTGLTGLTAAQEADLAGTWYLASAVQDGVEMDASMYYMMGVEITLNLNEDGTAELSMSGQAVEGTWDADGNISFNDTPNTYEIIDGKLQFTQGTGMMVFVPEKPEIKQVTITPAVEDPQLSDFDGTWNATIYDMMGMMMPLKLTGFDISITLQDGAVSYTETIYDMNNNYAVDNIIEEEFAATLKEDGTLFIDFAGAEVLTKIAPGSSGFVCTLREDGMLTVSIPELDEQMESLAAASASTENEGAEGAENITIETEGSSSGGSEGGSSGEFSWTSFFIFEKAE